MSLPTIPSRQVFLRVWEGLSNFVHEVFFAAGIDVTGTAIFRGAVQSQNGIMTSIALGTPVAASNTSCVSTGLASNSASATFATPANPDVPRNVSVTAGANWDGGNVTVTGTDINGGAQNETITPTPGSTVAGAKIFTTVTGATKATQGSQSTSNTATLGYGTKLGVIGGLAIGPASAIYTRATTVACGALDVTNQGVDCSATPPDGTHAMVVNICQ